MRAAFLLCGLLRKKAYMFLCAYVFKFADWYVHLSSKQLIRPAK